jgi:hypothetical protein
MGLLFLFVLRSNYGQNIALTLLNLCEVLLSACFIYLLALGEGSGMQGGMTV